MTTSLNNIFDLFARNYALGQQAGQRGLQAERNRFDLERAQQMQPLEQQRSEVALANLQRQAVSNKEQQDFFHGLKDVLSLPKGDEQVAAYDELRVRHPLLLREYEHDDRIKALNVDLQEAKLASVQNQDALSQKRAGAQVAEQEREREFNSLVAEAFQDNNVEQLQALAAHDPLAYSKVITALRPERAPAARETPLQRDQRAMQALGMQQQDAAVAAAAKRLTPIPTEARKALDETSEGLRKITTLKSIMGQNFDKVVSAVGPLDQFTPDWYRSAVGKDFVSRMASLSADTIKEMAGSAVTESEMGRLRKFLVDESMSPDRIKTNLDNMEEAFRSIQERLNERYSVEQGFRNPDQVQEIIERNRLERQLISQSLPSDGENASVEGVRGALTASSVKRSGKDDDVASRIKPDALGAGKMLQQWEAADGVINTGPGAFISANSASELKTFISDNLEEIESGELTVRFLDTDGEKEINSDNLALVVEELGGVE